MPGTETIQETKKIGEKYAAVTKYTLRLFFNHLSEPLIGSICLNSCMRVPVLAQSILDTYNNNLF